MKKILLIEDNFEMRENITEILELAGFEVNSAENGKIGVQKATEWLPDLIICDVMMPELDGYGVLHMLSRNTRTHSIPFIFLTAKADKQDVRKGMNLGADDYIVKPFEELELLDAIEMRLKKSMRWQEDVGRDADSVNQFLETARASEALEMLSEDRETRIYQPKDLLYQEGATARFLMFIQKGKVKTYKTNQNAKEYISGLHKAGDFLGYTALLQDSPYAESAMVLENAEVLMIPKEDFLALMYNNRDVSQRFIKLLSAELEDKEEQLLHLAYDTVRKRVADALLLLRTRYQENEQKPFSMAISRDNLASIVGTSKECVIRVLSEFKTGGIVDTHQSEIVILKPERLADHRW